LEGIWKDLETAKEEKMGCIKNKEVEEIDVFSRKRREKTRLKS